MEERGRHEALRALTLEEKKLVERLLAAGALSEKNLLRLLAEKSSRASVPLGVLLLDGGYVPPDRLDDLIARALKEFEELLEEGDRLVGGRSSAEAVQSYSRAIEIKPSDSEGHFRRAIAYLALENPALASVDIDRAIELDGRDTRVLVVRALLHLRAGACELALGDLSTAISIEPRASILRVRGSLYRRQGDALAALLDLSKALEIDPTYGEAAYSRGWIRYERGDCPGAMSDFVIALSDRRASSVAKRNSRTVLESALAKGLLGAEQAAQVRILLDEFRPSRRRSREISISGEVRLFPPRRSHLVAATIFAVTSALAGLLWIAMTPLELEVVSDSEPPPEEMPAIAPVALRPAAPPQVPLEPASLPVVDYDALVALGAMTREEAVEQTALDVEINRILAAGSTSED